MKFAGLQKLDLLNCPGRVSATVFTRGCNFRCPYCHNPSLVLPPTEAELDSQVDEEEIISYLDKRRGMIEAVAITGGEPTLHPEIEGFMKKVKEMGFFVKLDTNGTNPDFLKKLLKEGVVDYVAMDFKTAVEHYDRVFASSSAVEAFKASLKLLSSSSIDWEVRTTCVPSVVTKEDFPKIKEVMDGLGVKYKWYLQAFNPAVTLDESYSEELAYEQGFLEFLVSEYASEKCDIRIR
ncbi:MAG: anaerobic ribonucleoside-triphosphate reductase activating protein [Sphaerochaetaceae bacterium]|nr:anaerobic ribonucleoside-triphosphate reductase activating protein [Sphaerochaetaceae bacterium]